MRPWLEVLMVLVCVAVGARLFMPRQPESVPTEVAPSDTTEEYLFGGYSILGADPARAIGGLLHTPHGAYEYGKKLVRDSKIVLQATDPRDKVTQVLGKPVGFNSDNSKWGYWTRGLPNPKMGILISFNKQNEIEQIDLASDWSRLATQMALDSIPKKR